MKFTYDIFQTMEAPTIVLSTRWHRRLGVISTIPRDSINMKYNMSAAQEISFDVYKYRDETECELWDQIVDHKYIYIPEFEEYYSIEISMDDAESIVKHVTGTSACEVELGQKIVRSLEINTESDRLAQEDDYRILHGYTDANGNPDYSVNVANMSDFNYILTIFFNPDNPKYSLVHRVLSDKGTNYSIGHVDETLYDADMRKRVLTFSISNQDIYSILTNTIANEVGCLFNFDSVNRVINIYDIRNQCKACGYTGIFDVACPKCGSMKYSSIYGKDTGVHISTENYASQISVSGNASEVKSCIYVSGGDDIMSSAFADINPTGSRYMYKFSDAMYEDMPDELIQALEDYQARYDTVFSQDTPTINYPEGSSHWYTWDEFTNLYWDLVDEELYLQTGMLPESTAPADTTAQKQMTKLLKALSNNPVAITADTTKGANTIGTIVKNYCNTVIDFRYTTTISGTPTYNDKMHIWTGSLTVSCVDDTTDEGKADTVTTDNVNVTINTDFKTYLEQKSAIALEKTDMVFQTLYHIPYTEADNQFKKELKKYAYDHLAGFLSAYESLIEVVTQQGINENNRTYYGGDTGSEEIDIYDNILKPYQERYASIQAEMDKRENEIKKVQKKLKEVGEIREAIRKELNLETFLENIQEGLYNILLIYIREDTYTNSNFISDGLENDQIIEKARELYQQAQIQLLKASELQYTLTDTVHNLLSTEEFAPLRDKIELGNWIVCMADDMKYKLRLTSVGVNFGNLADLSLTFSNAIRVGGYTSDVKSLLSSTQSMATSFGFVSRQAKDGSDANIKWADAESNGLNANEVSVLASPNKDISIDEHGITMRYYDSDIDGYSPKQAKIQYNSITFTDDNWKNTKAALGEFRYRLDGEEKSTYGLNADTVIAGLIVSGDIYSSNYSTVKGQEAGTHFDLDDGEFSLAGGSLTYKDNRLILKNTEILWDTSGGGVNTPEIKAANIEDLDGYVTSKVTEEISQQVVIDSALDDTSPNPVQNRVIYEALENLEVVVDDELSTTSVHPVQNKVITEAINAINATIGDIGTVLDEIIGEEV